MLPKSDMLKKHRWQPVATCVSLSIAKHRPVVATSFDQLCPGHNCMLHGIICMCLCMYVCIPILAYIYMYRVFVYLYHDTQLPGADTAEVTLSMGRCACVPSHVICYVFIFKWFAFVFRMLADMLSSLAAHIPFGGYMCSRQRPRMELLTRCVVFVRLLLFHSYDAHYCYYCYCYHYYVYDCHS